ncbi:MAG TPA: hypothetical protein VM580_13040, partial [Labilithrix sp.]|nr:hypothetical protein [Labilithrix sp.]
MRSESGRGVTAAALTAATWLIACEPFPGTGTDTSSSSSSSGAGPTASSSSAPGRRPIDREKLCQRLVGECRQATTTTECFRSL